MKISRLIELHRKFQNHGLAESLGDGYLMAHNRVYRNVRQAALDGGFRFSSHRNEAYETFPLLQLENILRAKVLPYANNLAAFELMTSAELSVLEWQDVDGNLKKNSVFHESIHGIVRGLTKIDFSKANVRADIDSQRNFALDLLVEESCANTCELFGAIEVSDPTHRIFYEMNSYMTNFEYSTNLKKAMSEIGEDAMIRFLCLSYLEANFLKSGLEDRDFKLMVEMSRVENPDAKNLKTLRALSKIAFQLNERFRFQTASFHFALAGIKTPLRDLFAYDFLAVLRDRENFGGIMKNLVTLIASITDASKSKDVIR